MFHNSNVFGSCIIQFYIQGALKLKKNSGAKRLTHSPIFFFIAIFWAQNSCTHIPFKKNAYFLSISVC